MTVHQLLPTWEPGAIGAHAVQVAKALRAAGVACETWADDVRGGLALTARPTSEFFAAHPRARRGDVVLFHTAMATPTADALLGRDEPLVLDHHNVTPPEFFDGWEPALAENLEAAQQQVARLARRAALGLGDSVYNVEDLVVHGCRRAAVVPILADPVRPAAEARVAELRTATSGGAAWLTVGRIAPNKAPHDIVRAFACYRATFDPHARLRIVGGAPFAGYLAAVQRTIDALGVRDAVDVTGPVDDYELGAHYAAADVFVTLSRHEGFCVPLVEAMAAGVPVVALAATATPETAGDAAMLVARAEPALVATAVHRTVADRGVRTELVARGRRRAATLDPARGSARLVELLQSVITAA